jgi:hypothetical protein
MTIRDGNVPSSCGDMPHRRVRSICYRAGFGKPLEI